ncbi:PilZ domain-containing protein [Candidatus Reidiella endopervernicosa]|uniref:PilZ domain-containing protein n=1 Tax=Candidatus Reidiella endopervernicosa TaxID=2738883 RepID=A0A6N0HVP1_9GAMM|nr:PilZ domain-containing protein [Candidatus Reidiella endopervernicosa]QKQ26410.1 PilZ domain-containing protein [Candidatus Reidiella endopervernicosa]
MYEDIQARHKKGSEKRAAAKKPAVAKPRQLTGTSAATELTAEEIEQMMLEQWRTLDIDQPEPLSMQYFSERTEARLEMSTAALLHHDEGGVELTTRDISPSGLCAITRTPIFLDEGSVVDIEIPAIEGKIGTVRSGYTILNVDHTKAGIQLRLQHSESDPDHRKAIDAFIDANNSRYRVDVSDELLTANALLTERLYTLSSALLPLFFCGDTDGARVGLVGVSDGNRAMLEQFKKGESGFDLSPFMQPHRLQHFLSCNTEQSCPEPLMMIFGSRYFAEACFGHPSPSKRQILNATVYAYGAPTSCVRCVITSSRLYTLPQ